MVIKLLSKIDLKMPSTVGYVLSTKKMSVKPKSGSLYMYSGKQNEYEKYKNSTSSHILWFNSRQSEVQ